MKNVFTERTHGYCYKHLTANLKDKFRGVPRLLRAKVLKQFADCTYASTKYEFDHCYAKLQVTGGQRLSSFIVDLPPEKWSNAYFEGPRYGQMTSYGCESWNSQIRDKRVLPITNFIDSIRILLMNQMNDRREKTATWSTKL